MRLSEFLKEYKPKRVSKKHKIVNNAISRISKIHNNRNEKPQLCPSELISWLM